MKGASEIPVLVTVDAEGGFYHRLKEKYGFGPATPAAEIGERDDLSFTHSAAGAIASMLAEVGIDMNLAPGAGPAEPGQPDDQRPTSELRREPEVGRRPRAGVRAGATTKSES